MELLAWLSSLIGFAFGLEEFFFADLSQQFEKLGPRFQYFPWLLFAGGMLATFPLIYRVVRLRSEMGKSTAFLLYATVVGAITYGLHVNARRLERTPLYPRLQFHLGQCNRLFGPLMQTSAGAFVVKKSVGLLPAMGQYVYWTAEDVCRALRLKSEFENPSPALCREVQAPDTYECFKKILTEMAPHSKPGILLHVQTGMRMLNGVPSTPAESVVAGIGQEVQSTLKLGDFLMYMNRLSETPGAPEEILDRMPPEKRAKWMDYARKVLPKQSLGPNNELPWDLPLPELKEPPAIQESTH